MRAPEEHMGELVRAYEARQPGALSPYEVQVDPGVVAVLDLIRARDAEVAEQARAETRAELNCVTKEEIAEQRRQGWPDFHPEHYCHECGHPNIGWSAPNGAWNQATASHPKGHYAILCPQCFVARWKAATGGSISWDIVPWPESRQVHLVAPDGPCANHCCKEPEP